MIEDKGCKLEFLLECVYCFSVQCSKTWVRKYCVRHICTFFEAQYVGWYKCNVLTYDIIRNPTDADGCRRMPTDADGCRRIADGLPTDCRRIAEGLLKDCRRMPTDADGHRRTPTDTDGHRRTPTDTDGRKPTDGSVM